MPLITFVPVVRAADGIFFIIESAESEVFPDPENQIDNSFPLILQLSKSGMEYFFVNQQII